MYNPPGQKYRDTQTRFQQRTHSHAYAQLLEANAAPTAATQHLHLINHFFPLYSSLPLCLLSHTPSPLLSLFFICYTLWRKEDRLARPADPSLQRAKHNTHRQIQGPTVRPSPGGRPVYPTAALSVDRFAKLHAAPQKHRQVLAHVVYPHTPTLSFSPTVALEPGLASL